jgi:hypothetical protein
MALIKIVQFFTVVFRAPLDQQLRAVCAVFLLVPKRGSDFQRSLCPQRVGRPDPNGGRIVIEKGG